MNDRFKNQKKIVIPDSDIEKFHLAVELLTRQTLQDDPTLSPKSAQMASYITVSEVMERTFEYKRQRLVIWAMFSTIHLN